jgi:predicted nucleic-acid-binding protein
LENKESVAQALAKFRTSRADFADCLIERCNRNAGCQDVFTFDKRASASGMTPLV